MENKHKSEKAHRFFAELHELVDEYGAGKSKPSDLLGPLCQILAYVTKNGNVEEAAVIKALTNRFIGEDKRRAGYIRHAGRRKIA